MCALTGERMKLGMGWGREGTRKTRKRDQDAEGASEGRGTRGGPSN